MERKWIGPNNYWIKYKEENGTFCLIESLSSTLWWASHLHRWDEIEQHMKMNGYVEDLSFYSPGSLPTNQDHFIDSATYAMFQQKDKNRVLNIDPAYASLPRCSHEWATYIGFMKTETYCTKCKEIQK